MVKGGKSKMSETEFWSVKDRKKVNVDAKEIVTQKKAMKNGVCPYIYN